MAFRDRDMTNGWTVSADGTREQRHSYAQPPRWRADVSAIFDNKWGGGAVMEWQKYSAYGVPFLITPGDHNKDGVVDKADADAFDEDYKDGVVSRADLNKDGVVDSDDETLFTASYAKATVGGRWKLSATSIGSRKGYAGYEHEGFGNDLAAPELAHVRFRALHLGIGRWTTRDPIEVPGLWGQYAYCGARAVRDSDPLGLLSNFEFMQHFYTGNGSPYVFGPAELAAYRSHPRIALAESQINNAVRLAARNDALAMFATLDCDCQSLNWNAEVIKRYPTVSYGVSRESFVKASPPGSILNVAGWYAFLFADWTFSIGGHFINYDTTCILYADCIDWHEGKPNHGMISFSCSTALQVRDPYQDPGSIAQMAARLGITINPGGPGVNFGGSPYVIWIDWFISSYGIQSVPRGPDPECYAGE